MPVDQYPGIPRHQIEHHHVQRMHRLCSASPPPLAQHYPAIVPPPMWPPAALPAQPYYNMPNQLPPMNYQVFAPPPQQPQIALGNRVDYTARLMENFNSTHQNRRNRRSNHRSSTAQSINAQAEAEDIEHRRRLQQQALYQQIELQRQLEIQRQQEIEVQRLWRQQQLEQELQQRRLLEQEQQDAIYEQEEIRQSQQDNAIHQIQQLSQALTEDALHEYSQRSGEQYNQDQQRQQQQSDAGSPSPSPSPRPSLPRRPSPGPAPRPPRPPAVPAAPLPDSDPSDSSSSDSEEDGNCNPSPPPLPPCCIPPGGRIYTKSVEPHTLGPMNIQCSNCHALHFISEKLSSSGVRNPRFGICCLQGQVDLPHIQRWPRDLQELFDDPQDRRQFKKKIRQYNNALAFTSMGTNMDNDAIQGSGPASFRIHGALHHLMGSLIPPDGLEASYAQLYIYDPQEATDRRLQRNPQLDGAILLDLHNAFRQINPYAPVYKQAYEVMRVSSYKSYYKHSHIKSSRLNLLKSIQIYPCDFIYNRLLMQEDTTCLLWKK